MRKWIAILLGLVLSYIGVMFSFSFLFGLLEAIGTFMYDFTFWGLIFYYIAFLGIQIFILWLCYKGIRYSWKNIRKNKEGLNPSP